MAMGVWLEWGSLPKEVQAAWDVAAHPDNASEEQRLEAARTYWRSGAAFQTAWGTMRDIVDVMSNLGMTCRAPMPEHIEEPESLDIGEEWWSLRDHVVQGTPLPAGVDPALAPVMRAYLEACDESLAREPYSPSRGIPLYKFSDNSPWLTSPDELRAALGAYRESGATAHDLWTEECECEQWDEWIRFMETAADHGGMRMG